MKKFLALIVVLTLMLTSAALAEGVPAPHFGTQTETEQTETVQESAAENETAEAADVPAETTGNADAEYSVPEGKPDRNRLSE